MRAEDSIKCIKGIGEKTALLYEKLGVGTVGDLLSYYPRSYERYEEPVSIREAARMDFAAVRVVLVSTPSVVQGGRVPVTIGFFEDAEGMRIRAVWYRSPYLRSTLKPGTHYVLRGKLKGFGRGRSFEMPQLITPDAYEEKRKSLQPIYPMTQGITSAAIGKAVAAVMQEGCIVPELLPEEIVSAYGFMERNAAVSQIHFPTGEKLLRKAHDRLAFEEFFRFLLRVRKMKEELEREKNHFALVRDDETEAFLKRLPFRLTDAQQKTWKEIEEDLTGHHMMYRMVQGDVGSGKTIIAFLAMYLAALCHYQSVLMAPTEVLARQHYQNFTDMAGRYGLDIRVQLLTGSMTASRKREALAAIENHEADLVVGTHALIQEKVRYHDLALVITDEQHRFGVRQRELLSEKGHTPHVLVMSATPIPRSLAMILYGDLDISVIDEKPSNRLPIKNCVVDIGYREKAWNFIRKKIGEGQQAYVICPMVEENEEVSGEDVIGYAGKLRNFYGNEVSVEILHGRMPDAEKDRIMTEYAAGRINVLVSTTVIEVGIDVPNATVILVENAERFGLAQLHQLRGRVGRGKDQSYCILINTSGKPEADERLEILNRENDGFVIAREDLRLRGPGDFFGLRQSGELAFHVADIYADAALLKQASEAVNRYLDSSGTAAVPGMERLI